MVVRAEFETFPAKAGRSPRVDLVILEFLLRSLADRNIATRHGEYKALPVMCGLAPTLF